MSEKASYFNEREPLSPRSAEGGEGSGGAGAALSLAGPWHHPRFLAALGMTGHEVMT